MSRSLGNVKAYKSKNHTSVTKYAHSLTKRVVLLPCCEPASVCLHGACTLLPPVKVQGNAFDRVSVFCLSVCVHLCVC